MDKITKALKKLSAKERSLIKQILTKVSNGDFLGLDIKKLKNQTDLYRVRHGKIRIIFQKKDEMIFILTIERRNDNTYNL